MACHPKLRKVHLRPKWGFGGRHPSLPLQRRVAGATGLEPATFGVTGRHSNQLSYAPARLRAKGADVGVRPLPCQAAYGSIRRGPAIAPATAAALLRALVLARRAGFGIRVEFLRRDLAVAILVHLIEQ